MNRRRTVTTYAEWLADRLAGGWGAEAPQAALASMARRDLFVTAAEADKILGLAPGSTLFFNHGGTVPADAVLDELARRAK
jgi:hypothetical protein